MKLSQLHKKQLNEGWGNVALDIVGLVPGLEAADAINAAWHAKNGEYFQAAMSLLSMIPALDDIAGKGTKYLSKSSPKMAALIAKYGDDIVKHWPKIKAGIEKSKEFAPYAKQIDSAVRQALSNEPETAPQLARNPSTPIFANRRTTAAATA